MDFIMKQTLRQAHKGNIRRQQQRMTVVTYLFILYRTSDQRGEEFKFYA